MHYTKKMPDHVRIEKNETRRKWCKFRTSADREMYVSQKKKYNTLLDCEETNSLSSKIMENSDNPKGMFKDLNQILNQKFESLLPPSSLDKS